MPAKLHEVIAVEGDLQRICDKVIDEATNTFVKKTDHFVEQVTRLEMLDAERVEENSADQKKMVDTIDAKLRYVMKHVNKYYDAISRKERTNQEARADLVVRGQVLIESMPATLLLGLETRLKQLRSMCEAIPTLQPGIEWVRDDSRPDNVYKMAEPRKRLKTEKDLQHKVLQPQDEHHAAQIEKWHVDKVVGKYYDQIWNSMLSPLEKSQLLERIDDLLQAAKKARQRANATEVVDLRIGRALTGYILGFRTSSSEEQKES